MDKEKDEFLVKNFPRLYADRHGDLKSTCMVWGFWVGNGWFEIIKKMSEKLEKLINASPEWCCHCSKSKSEHPYKGKWRNEEIECSDFEANWIKAVQVKEKLEV